ncbi:MAG: nucleotidyltransferase domain-containing protein [Elusimicrobiota bacterium]
MKFQDEKALYFSQKLRERVGKNLKHLFLFGSRARGNASEGSDYDFAVILNQKDHSSVSDIRSVEVDFLNKFDNLSASLIYDVQGWEKRKNWPLGINILRDGVEL